MPIKKKTNRRRERTTARDMPELQQARAYWINNRFVESLSLFDKAVRKEPRNPVALADAARAFGSRFEIERAEALLNRLVDIARSRADLLRMAGQSYRMIQRPQKAIDCLERSATKDGTSLETRLELAMLYERQHCLDVAADHVAACLASHPDLVEAAFLKGRLQRRQGEMDAAERTLNQVVGKTVAHWTVRAQALAELAIICEQAGRLDEAMSFTLEAKSLIHPNAKDELRRATKESEHLEHLLDQLTPDHFARWRDQAASLGERKVSFLTGPPRSGTTLLEKVLDAHPNIISSDEQVAFPKFVYPAMLSKPNDDLLGVADLDQIPLERISKQRDRYLRYMEGALGDPIGGRWHLDKNPSIIMLIPGMMRLWRNVSCCWHCVIRETWSSAVSCDTCR